MYAVCSWSVTPQANPLYNHADKSREAGAVSPALALFSSYITSDCGPALRWLLAASDYQSTCSVAVLSSVMLRAYPRLLQTWWQWRLCPPPPLRIAPMRILHQVSIRGVKRRKSGVPKLTPRYILLLLDLLSLTKSAQSFPTANTESPHRSRQGH